MSCRFRAQQLPSRREFRGATWAAVRPRYVEQHRVDRLKRAILWSRSPIRRDPEVTMCADTIHGEQQRDVVIIGAGTAGTSCALECFDIQLDTAVLETDARPG